MKLLKRLFSKKPDKPDFIQDYMNKDSQRIKGFSLSDMKDAFEAGDKYRLYLDKNAVGLGYPHDKGIPSSDEVFKTMSFEKWIKTKLRTKK